MSARQKLNSHYVGTSLVIGGLLGYVTGLFMVFVLASGALLVASIHTGEIRMSGSRGKRQRRRRD